MSDMIVTTGWDENGTRDVVRMRGGVVVARWVEANWNGEVRILWEW